MTLIVSILAGCYVRRALYPAPEIAVPPQSPEGMREISLELPDSQSAVCWVYDKRESDSAAPVLLFLHGNGENLETMRQSGMYDRLARLEVNFIALDYPGYGRSRGKPSEKAVAAACDAALGWIAREYPHSRIIICGWSLGAAAAIGTAARNTEAVSGLIAMSAWTTLYDVARQFYPRFLVKIAVAEKYNSLESIAHVKCPVLLLHGTDDRLIPCDQGEKLSRAAPKGTRWVPIPGYAHNDLPGNPAVWEEIALFIRNAP